MHSVEQMFGLTQGTRPDQDPCIDKMADARIVGDDETARLPPAEAGEAWAPTWRRGRRQYSRSGDRRYTLLYCLSPTELIWVLIG